MGDLSIVHISARAVKHHIKEAIQDDWIGREDRLTGASERDLLPCAIQHKVVIAAPDHGVGDVVMFTIAQIVTHHLAVVGLAVLEQCVAEISEHNELKVEGSFCLGLIGECHPASIGDRRHIDIQ